MLSRRFTGAGSFTEFAIEGELSESRRTLSLPVLVTIPGLHEGLGVVAFREGDRLTLETYTFGDEKWDGAFEGFVIA
jgi:hypothetical protein